MTILSHAIRMKGMLFKKPYNKPLINLDRLVITGKYQTEVFYVRTEPSRRFPLTTALSVNKKLIYLTVVTHLDFFQYCELFRLVIGSLLFWNLVSYLVLYMQSIN